MSNRLDPDQARHFVEPNLGPNSLKRLQQMTLVGKELLFINPCINKVASLIRIE